MRLKSPTVALADGTTSSVPTSNPCKGKNPTTSNDTKKTSCLRPLLLQLSLLPLLLANAIPPAAAAAASRKEHTQVHVQESRGQEATASVPLDVANTGRSREHGPLRRKRKRRRQRQAREVDRKVSRSEHFRQHPSTVSSAEDDGRNDGKKRVVNYAQVQAPTADAASKVQIAKLHFYTHSKNAAQKEPSPSVHIDKDGQYNYAQYADDMYGMHAVVDQKQERPDKVAKLQFYPMQQHPQPKQPSDGHVAHLTFYQLDTADHTNAGTNRGYAKTDANVGNPKRGGAEGTKERGEGLLAWIAKQQVQQNEQNADVEWTTPAPLPTMAPNPTPIPKPTSLQPTLGPTHGPVVSTVTNSPLSHSTALDGEPQNKMGDVPAHDVGAGEGSTEAESEASQIASNGPTASPSSHQPTILTTPPSALPTTGSSFDVAAQAASPETEISQSSASYYYTSVSYSYSYSYEYSMSMEYGGGAGGAGRNGVDDRYGNRYGHSADEGKHHEAQSSSYQHARRERRRLRGQRLRQQRQRQRRIGMTNILRARDITT